MEGVNFFRFYDMLIVFKDEFEGMIVFFIDDIVEFKLDIIVFDFVIVFG